MSIVFLLIPLGLVLVAAAAAALIWAVDSGQYDGDVEENGAIALEENGAVALEEEPGRNLSGRRLT